MKSCHDYQELISRLIDEDLTAEERGDVERHIVSCPDCKAIFEAFQALSETLGEDLSEPPERLQETIMADVRREALRKRQAPKRVRGYLAMAACAALVLLAAMNLPHMGSAGSMSASVAVQEAPQAMLYESEAATVYESADASEADYGAADAMFDNEPAEGADTARSETAAAAPAAAPDAQSVAGAVAEEEPAEEKTPVEEPVPSPSEEESFSVWPFLLVGLPLLCAVVILLLRKKR